MAQLEPIVEAGELRRSREGPTECDSYEHVVGGLRGRFCPSQKEGQVPGPLSIILSCEDLVEECGRRQNLLQKVYASFCVRL